MMQSLDSSHLRPALGTRVERFWVELLSMASLKAGWKLRSWRPETLPPQVCSSSWACPSMRYTLQV